MFKGIDVISREWCNIIFQGKNRAYGAYYLRMTSSRRHLQASLILVFSVILFIIIATPSASKRAEKIKTSQEVVTMYHQMDLDKPEKEDQKEKDIDEIAIHASHMQLVAVEWVDPDKFMDAPRGDIREKGGGSGDAGADMGLNASLRDDKGTDAAGIYAEAERIKKQLAEGKKASEQGYGELAKIEAERRGGGGKGGGGTGTGTGSGRGDGKGSGSGTENEVKNPREQSKGNVYISYFLERRYDTNLYFPAYTCQYGGTVVVDIVVDRNGNVISAKVQSSSSKDDCIAKMALQAAYASTFNSSSEAPAKQSGTITYRFIAQ